MGNLNEGMLLKRYFIALAAIALVILGCNKDDDSLDIEPPRDRGEQQAVDKDSLLGYLNTHYYNSSLFETTGNYSIDDVIISELPKDDDGNYLPLPEPDKNTLLIDDVVTKTFEFAETEYEVYYLKLTNGEGENPMFSDDVLVSYSGQLLNDSEFDKSNNPITFDLLGVVPGWRYVMIEFNTSAEDAIINSDGTISYDKFGLGVMFLPSGLGYFNSGSGSSIPAYSPLIFKFELYRNQHNDHDGDGILSHLEDLNGNLNPLDEDTDEDNIPNFNDPDDDGDGVLTNLEDLNGNGIWTDDDTNGNGIPNYLDRLDRLQREEN